MNQAIKLIIGLGNPDKKYHNTYHNVGYLFIDTLDSPDAIKSDVYMNKSGEFVRKEMKKRNLKPKDLLIVHDDSDIELGKTKLCLGRGSAGHRGVQNIIDQLKSKDFWRLRIGIRNPKERIRQKADQLVLKKISPANKKVLEKVFEEINKQLGK